MMALASAVAWVAVGYFTLMHAGYVVLEAIALARLRRTRGLRDLEHLPPVHAGFEPPVSVLLPVRNQAASVAGQVRTLLALEYSDLEIVVVVDESTDGTLEALREAFELEPFPEAYWRRLQTRPVRAVYHSRRVPKLRVVDKEHGGRADALNVAINASRHPLFCVIQPGTAMTRESLRGAAAPFVEDPRALVTAWDARLDEAPAALVRLQVVEQLRGLYARVGWAAVNAALVVPTAFAVFRKDSVVEAGGYRSGLPNEDVELILRLHRVMRERRQAYAIQVLPEPACRTGPAASMAGLKARRMEEHRALLESLQANIALASRRGGIAGTVAFPFIVAFECFGPLVELALYAMMAGLVVAGLLPPAAFGAFLLMVFALGWLASVCAIALEEASFRREAPPTEMPMRVLDAIVENAGYRQLVSYWRAQALIRWWRELRGRGRPSP